MTCFRKLIFFIVLFFFNPANAEDMGQQARDLINSLMKECNKVAYSLQGDDDSTKVSAILDKYFDIEAMSEFVANRYWKKINNEKKREVVVFYKNFLTHNYLPIILEHKNFTYVIDDKVVSSKIGYVVTIKIYDNSDKSRGAGKLTIRYLVSPSDKNQKLMVNDLIVDGVSMLVNHRSDFSYVLNHEGIDGLLER